MGIDRDHLQIPGVILQDELGHGAYTTVYRAVRDPQAPPTLAPGVLSFAVKIYHEQPSEQSAAEFRRQCRREAAFLACLRHPGLSAILDVGELDGSPYVVMEYVEGRTLSAVLLDSGTLDEEVLVALAQSISGALAEVHRHSLVHRDVKPSNILLDKFGRFRLIDFGFATRANHEEDSTRIVGTFLYSSPEQTLTLRRPLDGRADLYSLGVVLFQAATGQPPFRAADVQEVIRQHATVVPPPVHSINAAISPGLSAIIARLLAKDPDDRYRNAASLSSDLAQLATINVAIARDGEARLGADEGDLAGDLPLIGRKDELEVLLSHWMDVMDGKSRMVLLHGAAGSGKSRLLRELVDHVRRTGSLILGNKCARVDAVPMSPLRRMFEEFASRVIVAPPLQRKRGEDAIRAGAAEFAPLLRNLSPTLAGLLAASPQSATPEMGDTYLEAVTNLLLAIARHHNHTLLVLEDVHWLDDATRQVLLRLAHRLADARVLVVLTVRSEDAEIQQRLMKDFQLTDFFVMGLAPMTDAAVAGLIKHGLGGHAVDESFLAQIVRWSQGNPLAAHEYLRALIDGGWMRLSWGRWFADPSGVTSLPLSSDTLQLMLRRIGELTDAARYVLSAAAVIGSQVEVGTLCKVCDKSEGEVLDAIAAACAASLLEPARSETYGFVHDRVQEALLSALPEAARTSLHQRVAIVLDAAGAEHDDRVFSLARHYRAGLTAELPRRVFETNFAAGLRSLSSHAPDEAYDFFAHAARYGQLAGVDITPELEMSWGIACVRTDRFVEAIAHYEQALRSTDPLERAEVHMLLGRLYETQFDVGRAWMHVSSGLNEIGNPIPNEKLRNIMLGLGYAFLTWWQRAPPRASGRELQRQRLLQKLYQSAGQLSYLEGNKLNMLHVLARVLHNVKRLGPCQDMVFAYSGVEVYCALARRRDWLERLHAYTVGIAENLNDPIAMGRVCTYHAIATHIYGLPREAEEMSWQTLHRYGRWLDSRDAVFCRGDLAYNLLIRGHFRQAWHALEQQIQRDALLSSVNEAAALNLANCGPILAALGRGAEGHRYLQRYGETSPHLQYRQVTLLQNLVLFHLEQGEYGMPLEEAIAKHQKALPGVARVPYQWRFFYVYHAWACIAQEQAGGNLSRRHMRGVLSRLRQAAVGKPSLWGHFLASSAWAALLWEKSPQRSLALAAQAEAQAQDVNNVWVLFEIARLRALIEERAAHHDSAVHYARLAYWIASDHGWMPRARRVLEQFHLEDVTHSSSTSASNSLSASGSAHRYADSHSIKRDRHLEALLQVTLAANSVLDPAEQSRLAMDEIIRILGAERAFLFMVEDGKLNLRVGRDAQRQHLDELKGYSSTVVEQVRATRRPLVVSGTEEGALLGSISAVAHDLRSIIAAPLMLRDQVIGVMYLDNRLARGIFTDDDVQILQALANLIAVALQTSRAAQLEIQVATESNQRRLAEVLRDLMGVSLVRMNIEGLLEHLCVHLQAVVPSSTAQAFHLQGKLLSAVNGPNSLDAADPRVEEIVRTSQPLLSSRQGSLAVLDWLGVPIIWGDNMVGLVVLECDAPQVYTSYHVELAMTFARQAEVLIQNVHLFSEVHRLATTDELTGLLNRREFFGQAEKLLDRQRQQGKAVAAIMFDVDHFKRFNDEYGHHVGDQVLRIVSERCRRQVKHDDILGRYGGEEFAVLLPATLAQAEGTAERLRRVVAESQLDTEKGIVRITISLGVAASQDGTNQLAELLKSADKALYRAKEGGRNQVACYEGEATDVAPLP